MRCKNACLSIRNKGECPKRRDFLQESDEDDVNSLTDLRTDKRLHDISTRHCVKRPLEGLSRDTFDETKTNP